MKKSQAEKTKRYDQRLQEILHRSAQVIAEKGFHNASVRDISRATGISLAGLYYYFQTKEELLFLILEDAFTSVQESLQEGIEERKGEQKIHFFVHNHLSYFANNLAKMKVASHESDSLSGDFKKRVEEKKRVYFESLVRIVDEVGPGRKGMDPKLAALSLFGMINWIYTWYRPEKDRSIERVATQMSEVFLSGYLKR